MSLAQKDCVPCRGGVPPLSGEQIALSCHLVVAEELLAADSEHLVRKVEEAICGRFGIGHTTIQVEACHPCDETLGHAAGDHNHPHVQRAGIGD